MSSLALSRTDLFSVITTDDRGAAAWRTLRNWPDPGHAHIDFAAGTEAQRNLWAARLDEAVRHAARPVLLVASGESCFAAAWWARLSPASYVARIAGALLFAPPAREDAMAAGHFASPRIALPFPSAIVPEARLEGATDARLLSLAQGWGAGVIDGELPAHETGGAWHLAQAALMRLMARRVEGRMRAAEALGIIE